MLRYQDNGHTKGVPEFEPPKPIRLQWNLEPVLEAIDKSYQVTFSDTYQIKIE